MQKIECLSKTLYIKSTLIIKDKKKKMHNKPFCTTTSASGASAGRVGLDCCFGGSSFFSSLGFFTTFNFTD